MGIGVAASLFVTHLPSVNCCSQQSRGHYTSLAFCLFVVISSHGGTFHFSQLFCPNEICPMGNPGCLPLGKPAATESRYPTYGAWWVFECFHNPSNSDMDYGIFNVRTDVNAGNCTRGCTDTVRESALKVDSRRKKKKNLPRRGIKPASAACRSDALPTGLHLHRLVREKS